MSRIQFIHTYEHIISIENLLLAWREFLSGKKTRKDVLEFERNLMGNIIELHNELVLKNYRHSDYHAFNISDPKPRSIHKASVRDRLLHHAIYRVLYPFFDRTFIADSYSCRRNKGTHRAIDRFRAFSYKVSKNNTRTVWVLKCDIRKFFENIDHEILKSILAKYISDQSILQLLDGIIDSFPYPIGLAYGVRAINHISTMVDIAKCRRNAKGLPLGNLTSQLLVNIYMNEFDQFVKHKLKTTYYIRYADDFVFMSDDRKWLENILPQVADFLEEQLKLSLHPDKVFIKTLASGVDFLGWVHFPNHRVVRTVTKRRMWKRMAEVGGKEETVQSYLGLLSHGNAKRISKAVISKYMVGK